MTTFNRIKQLADNKGYSLQHVAEEIGFSPNLIYRWQSASPKGKDLAKVAKYLNTTTDYLLGLTEDPIDHSHSAKEEKHVDLAQDEVVLSYNGKPVTKHEWKVIQSLLEDDE